MIETQRICRECGETRPIEKYERVKSSYYGSKFTWCQRRICNSCIHQRRKNAGSK